MAISIQIIKDKNISVSEFSELMQSVGFGTASNYNESNVSKSLTAYPFIAHARTDDGNLVGYVSAFSDGAFSTFIGEIVVRPSYQKQGIGKQLLSAVETFSGKVPIYVSGFDNNDVFFKKLGYKESSRPMTVLIKHLNAVAKCT